MATVPSSQDGRAARLPRTAAEWAKLVSDTGGERLGITFNLDDLRRIPGEKLGPGSSITDLQFLFLRVLYVAESDGEGEDGPLGDLVRHGFITVPTLKRARQILKRRRVKHLISLSGNATVLGVGVEQPQAQDRLGRMLLLRQSLWQLPGPRLPLHNTVPQAASDHDDDTSDDDDGDSTFVVHPDPGNKPAIEKQERRLKPVARDEIMVLHVLINLLNSCFLEAAHGDPVIHAVADQGLFRVTTQSATEVPSGVGSAAHTSGGSGLLYTARVDGTVRPSSSIGPVLDIVEVKRDVGDTAGYRKQHAAEMVAYLTQRQRENHDEMGDEKTVFLICQNGHNVFIRVGTYRNEYASWLTTAGKTRATLEKAFMEVRTVGPCNIHRRGDLGDVLRIFVARYFVLMERVVRVSNEEGRDERSEG